MMTHMRDDKEQTDLERHVSFGQQLDKEGQKKVGDGEEIEIFKVKVIDGVGRQTRIWSQGGDIWEG